MDAKGKENRYKICYYILSQCGKIINRTENRHLQLNGLVDFDRPIYAVITQLSPPSMATVVSGNMDTSNFEPNLTACPICLGEFTTVLGLVKGTFIALSCEHRFHMSCVAGMRSSMCPICRNPISESTMEHYRMYAPATSE